jgi:hypothetical protein
MRSLNWATLAFVSRCSSGIVPAKHLIRLASTGDATATATENRSETLEKIRSQFVTTELDPVVHAEVNMMGRAKQNPSSKSKAA